MSKMDTEVIATSAFKLAISKTDLLSPFVNEKDKEPSWDGHIYIYTDKRKTKENIKRVPVQVKGEAVNRRKVKEHITYDIDYDDLMAYLSDGGAIYIVVYIDETTGEPLQIYYISLLPEKIKNILKKENKGKSQRFKKFPVNKARIIVPILDYLIKILYNLYHHKECVRDSPYDRTATCESKVPKADRWAKRNATKKPIVRWAFFVPLCGIKRKRYFLCNRCISVGTARGN